METWQVDVIHKNLHKLIHLTKCDTNLLAKLEAREVLTRPESDTIANQTSADTDKSYKLFNILTTRTGSYDIIKEALQENLQSGAYEVLVSSMPPDSSFLNTLNTFGDLKIDDNFKGRNGNILEFCNGRFGKRKSIIKIYVQWEQEIVNGAIGELDILQELDWHSNIIRCLYSQFHYSTRPPQLNGRYVLALEEGTRLLDLLTKPQNYTLKISEHSLDVCNQIINGVKFLQSCSVLHLNLKPGSIFVRQCMNSVYVKIGEFNVARRLQRNQTEDKVNPKVLDSFKSSCLNTPEILNLLNNNQIQNDDDPYEDIPSFSLSYVTDVFCVGMIIYSVLSGGYDAFGNKAEKLRNIIYGEPRIDESLLTPLIDTSIIKEMLSASPENRPDISNVVLCLK